MYYDVSYFFFCFINGLLLLCQIYFVSVSGLMLELVYQVDFLWLEIVLEGEFIDMSIIVLFIFCDVFYVLVGGWNIL